MLRRVLIVSVLSVAALGLAVPSASATIHEIVGSHCSGHHAQLSPPGQTPGGSDADQSELRALLATGVYDDSSVRLVEPGPPPTFKIVPADIDHPASKFTWDGETFIGPIAEDLDGDGETDVLLILPALVPDHPSLEHCANLES